MDVDGYDHRHAANMRKLIGPTFFYIGDELVFFDGIDFQADAEHMAFKRAGDVGNESAQAMLTVCNGHPDIFDPLAEVEGRRGIDLDPQSIITDIVENTQKAVNSMESGKKEIDEGDNIITQALKSLQMTTIKISQVNEKVKDISLKTKDQIDRSKNVHIR